MKTEYTILAYETTEELEVEVLAHIERGWVPQGGVALSLSESDDYQYRMCAQAMTRTSPDDT